MMQKFNGRVMKPRKPKTSDYRPSVGSIPIWSDMANWGAFSLSSIDEMRRDAQVNLCLTYKTAPIYTAEFDVEADGGELDAYIHTTIERFWRYSLQYALECFPYGRSPSEIVYKEETGHVYFDYLKPIHPRDAKPFILEGKLAYVQVQNVRSSYESDKDESDSSGTAELFSQHHKQLSEVAWFVHDGKYSPWYGRPILIAAWLPWRLKNMPDGAVEVIAKWFYKHAFSGMVVKHPNTTYSNEANPEVVVSAQELARQMAEWAKAGANFCMSSERDDKGNLLWEIESYGKIEGDVSVLTPYIDWLDKQIQRGILIPDEVISHDGDSGGGYSRAQVAQNAFILSAEQDLNQIFETFNDQILRPCVTFNFGPDARYSVKPRSLLEQQQMGQQQPGQQAIMPPDGQPGQGQFIPDEQQPQSLSTGVKIEAPKPNNPWTRMQGKHGSTYWVNNTTGEKRWQQNQPMVRGTGEQPAAHQRQPAKQPQVKPQVKAPESVEKKRAAKPTGKLIKGKVDGQTAWQDSATGQVHVQEQLPDAQSASNNPEPFKLDWNKVKEIQSESESHRQKPTIEEHAARGLKESPSRVTFKDTDIRFHSLLVPKDIVDQADAWKSSLSEMALDAIKTYTSVGDTLHESQEQTYAQANSKIRECPDTLDCLSSFERTLLRRLDAAIVSFGDFAEPTNMWRGINLDDEGSKRLVAEAEHALGTNKVMRLNGITSMSIAPHVAQNFSKSNLMLEVKAKRGAYVAGVSAVPHEKEVIQRHGEQYKVVGVKRVPFAKQNAHETYTVIQLEQI